MRCWRAEPVRLADTPRAWQSGQDRIEGSHGAGLGRGRLDGLLGDRFDRKHMISKESFVITVLARSTEGILR